MKIIATDLDRTLIPNGDKEYDGTLPLFERVVSKNKLGLIFVTGRNLKLTKKGIKKYNLPKPDYLIGSVGANIYYCNNGRFKFSKEWERFVKRQTPSWNRRKIIRILSGISGLKLQGKFGQEKFKISFYADYDNAENILKIVKDKLKDFEDIKVIFSYDKENGMIDVMPKCSGKIGAINFLVDKMGVKKSDVVFCGDSGNDLLVLGSEYKAILVANSRKSVKKQVLSKKKAKKNLYVAKKTKRFNGNYVSGILQGLAHFGFISKKDLE